MKREIPSLYILKFMSCVLILIIHTQPFSSLEWNTFVIPLTRIGVPLFFMVTGYFMYQKLYLSGQSYTGFDASKKSIKKLIKIFVASSLLFLLFELIVDGKDVILGNITSLKRWIYFAFMNVPFWGGHLWYILADIYILICVAYLIKLNKTDLLNLFWGGRY